MARCCWAVTFAHSASGSIILGFGVKCKVGVLGKNSEGQGPLGSSDQAAATARNPKT